jgi:hypothetical protein
MNFKLSLVIERRVNAKASPDWPKPLKQWGALAAAWRRQVRIVHATGVLSLRERDNRKDSVLKTNTQVYFRFAEGMIKRIALAPSLAVKAPLWLTPRYARLCLEHVCITCTGNK